MVLVQQVNKSTSAFRKKKLKMEIIYPPINFRQFQEKVYQWRGIRNLYFKKLNYLLLIQNDGYHYCVCNEKQRCKVCYIKEK